MSCAKWEWRIALEVEGDLPERESERVLEHLAGCARCRVFAAELRESQAALKDWGDAAVSEADLAAVRAGVEARIADEGRRQWWWVWAWVPAAAMAAVLVAAFVWASRPVERLEIAVHARVPAAPALLAEARRPARKARVVREVPARHPAPPVASEAPKAPVEVEPLKVKFLTDDPDVVIVWLIDRKGD